MTDAHGMPYVVCPCWRHRLQWRLVRLSVHYGLRGQRRVTRLFLALSELVA